MTWMNEFWSYFIFIVCLFVWKMIQKIWLFIFYLFCVVQLLLHSSNSFVANMDHTVWLCAFLHTIPFSIHSLVRAVNHATLFSFCVGKKCVDFGNKYGLFCKLIWSYNAKKWQFLCCMSSVVVSCDFFFYFVCVYSLSSVFHTNS